MIIPRFPLLTIAFRNTLRVGTATYSTRGSEIIRSLFGPISISLYLAKSPQQAENITKQLNELAKKSRELGGINGFSIEGYARDCRKGNNAN